MLVSMLHCFGFSRHLGGLDGGGAASSGKSSGRQFIKRILADELNAAVISWKVKTQDLSRCTPLVKSPLRLGKASKSEAMSASHRPLVKDSDRDV